jgi:LysM repeat protein
LTHKRLLNILCLLIAFSFLISSCRLIPEIFTDSTQTLVPSPTNTETPTPESTATQTPVPTDTPTPEPTQTLTPTPLPKDYLVQEGDTLSSISELYGVPIIFIVLNNNIKDSNLIFPGQVFTITDSLENPSEILLEGKQIVVILSLQMTYAFEDGQLLKEFLVSTGLPNTPTVLGKYKIYQKYDSTRMTGDGYDLPNVPWTMYFYQGYSFHGTYWHNNFGHPMSHGCVNMKTDEAKWLYDWAPLGTSVMVLP